jgi:uncharacterized iron-regulated membrane protein
MRINKARLRRIHFAIAPFMALPLLLTLTTGLGFEFAVAAGLGSDFRWLLDLHRGKFGSIDLKLIYPLLNALGLLTLVTTGLLMWLQSPRRRSS